MDSFRLSEAIKSLYSFVWEDFCGFYLEAIKPRAGEGISAGVLDQTLGFFERICILLHPFMPFITEEIWQQLRTRKENESCMIAQWPEAEEPDSGLLLSVEEIRRVLTQIRDLRNKYGVKSAVPLPLNVQATGESGIHEIPGSAGVLMKLANISSFSQRSDEMPGAQSFMGMRHKYFLEMRVTINKDEERANLEKEIQYAQGFVESVRKKLENEKFVSNAPADLVDKEKQKLQDGLTRLEALKASLASL